MPFRATEAAYRFDKEIVSRQVGHSQLVKSIILDSSYFAVDAANRAVVEAGTILAKLATGLYVGFSDDASYGEVTQDAVGILFRTTAVTAGDSQAPMLEAFAAVATAQLTNFTTGVSNVVTSLDNIIFEE